MKHNDIDTMPVIISAKEISDAYYDHIQPERSQSLYLADEDDEGNEIPLCLVASGTDCDGTYGYSAYSADRVAGWFGYEHGQFVLAVPPDTIDSEYPPLGAYAIICTGKAKDEDEEPEPDAHSTEGLKLWRVTVEQVCSETIHVWAKTLKEARDAVNEDLGDYESQVHCWELDEVESTEVYEGEPTDSDSDYEEDPDDVHGNIYTVKDGKLADLD